MSVIPSTHVLLLCIGYVALLSLILFATIAEARHPRVLKLIFGKSKDQRPQGLQNGVPT